MQPTQVPQRRPTFRVSNRETEIAEMRGWLRKMGDCDQSSDGDGRDCEPRRGPSHALSASQPARAKGRHSSTDGTRALLILKLRTSSSTALLNRVGPPDGVHVNPLYFLRRHPC